jgi:hypothetical protein
VRWLLFVPVVLSAWSAPLVIVCVPLILLRGWTARDRGEKLWWLMTFLVIVVFPLTAEGAPSLLREALHQHHWKSALFHAIGYRVFCFFFLGEALAHPLPSVGWSAVNRLSLILAGICAVGTVLATLRRSTPNSFRRAPMALFYLILACPVLFVLRVDYVRDFDVWNPDRTWLWHQRYFFASTLLLGVLSGVVYERLFHPWITANPRARTLASVFLLGWLSLHTLRFQLFDWRSSSSWKHFTRQIRTAEAQVQQTGGLQKVHIQTGVSLFDFDLVIDRESAARDLVR